MKYGFVRVAAAIPSLKVADCFFNASEIVRNIRKAENAGADVVTFPELTITGYTCGDLFLQTTLRRAAIESLKIILQQTSECNIIAIVGLPIEYRSVLLNCAAVIYKGVVLGLVPKSYMPNYKEFYEPRWFASGVGISGKVSLDEDFNYDVPIGCNNIFSISDMKFGIEICEDLWAPIPPSTNAVLNGADIVFNLSASPDSIGKYDYIKQLLSQQSARCLAGYVYSSAGFGESTTDLVFPGLALIYENGTLLSEADRFNLEPQLIISDIDVERVRTERLQNTSFRDSVKLYSCEYNQVEIPYTVLDNPNYLRVFDRHPFVPACKDILSARCNDIFSIQINGLTKRMAHTNSKCAVIGISGGLDSTLALLVTVKTFDKLGLDRKGIIGVTMPGFGTTGRTYNNALNLMKSLGVSIKEISIKQACVQHFKDINQSLDTHDITYENGQARERTQILMDIANKEGGMVIGTGDLSELALGWATYNGDHMSMYGVNTSVPKTLVRYLVEWVAATNVDAESSKTLLDIADTPISPELIPADENGNISQKTEDLVGPYELHDYFLFYFVRAGFAPDKIYAMAKQSFNGVYENTIILKWLKVFFKRFFAQQFKRSCLPDGPKVGSVTLSPRGDWRMPSDASVACWMKKLEEIDE